MTAHSGKIAVVTGAARGIGLATANLFHSEGWRVVLLDTVSSTLEATFDQPGSPDDAMMIVCDVSVPGQILAVDGGFGSTGTGLSTLRDAWSFDRDKRVRCLAVVLTKKI